MDQTEVGLKAVVKALTDTIAGAIDPADHLAKEQLRLAASYIDFVRQRLHLIHAPVAVERHVAACGQRRRRTLADAALQGVHRQIVGQQRTGEADRAAVPGCGWNCAPSPISIWPR